MLATLLVPTLVLLALVNAVPLQPRSPLLDATSVAAGTQDTPFISTGGSNDGHALIARGLFNTFQGPHSGSTPSTNHEAPAPGNARPASVAPDDEESALSSITATSTTQGKSQPSSTTLSAVGVPPTSSNRPNVGENRYRFPDW